MRMLKIYTAAAFLALMSITTAHAQQTQPSEREYMLTLTKNQVGLIETALSKYPMPLELTAPLMQRILKEVDDQEKAVTPAPESK